MGVNVKNKEKIDTHAIKEKQLISIQQNQEK